MYKDRRGIYYNNFIDRILGIASPSLNLLYGGMGAVRERALERNFKNAERVEKWEVRAMRRNGKSYITVSKKSG
ncbi:hypothetical protein [Robinsoniella sp. KNHs210]|uniref:hypothetical protein n=1 Tax=Robinsoniella sp. KNHs210 TaxID=1469950 RepID=UPI00047F6A96|nr:hypothetical protein [Robinsoniella sp. KNHs210]